MPPVNIRKPEVFLFPRGIERDKWREMGCKGIFQ